MLRKFAALFCVAALSVVFVGCEPAEVPVGPAPPTGAETAPADGVVPPVYDAEDEAAPAE